MTMMMALMMTTVLRLLALMSKILFFRAWVILLLFFMDWNDFSRYDGNRTIIHG